MAPIGWPVRGPVQRREPKIVNSDGKLNPPGIYGWPILLGDADSIDGAHAHVDRENGRVEHDVRVRAHRGWFQWRSRGPRPQRQRRQPGDGSRMIAVAIFLLFVLAGGLLGVSYAAQFVMITAERHGQVIASNVEALSADVALMVFSLLALGLARKGLNAIVARWGVICMAGLSAAMNYAASNGGDWRSVLTYCGPSVLLAFVVDTTVSVIKKHYLGMRGEASPFVQLGHVLAKVSRSLAVIILYTLRFILAPVETPVGLRRLVLLATPLPDAPPKAAVVDITVVQPKAISQAHTAIEANKTKQVSKGKQSGPRGPRTDSKATKLVAAVEAKYGPLRSFPLDKVSPVCKEIAPTVGMDAGWARTVLRKAVLHAYAVAGFVPPQVSDKDQEAN